MRDLSEFANVTIRYLTNNPRGGVQVPTTSLPMEGRNTLLGLALLAALASPSATAEDEAVPDAGPNLSRPELRWCLFERIRIEGESDELNQHEHWEVDRYNGTVHALNEHCQNKRYRERDHRSVEAELTPQKRGAWASRHRPPHRGKGRARRPARVCEGRGRRRANGARGRCARTAPGPEMGRTHRDREDARALVRGAMERAIARYRASFGWVLGGLLERGSGRKARFEYCERHAGQRAEHNELVRGNTEQTGARTLSVQNGTGKDAYVKLVDEQGRAASRFLPARGERRG